MPPDFFISRLALLIAEITRIKSEHEIKRSIFLDTKGKRVSSSTSQVRGNIKLIKLVVILT